MASAAPGQSSSHQESYCYNCGMKGHWMFACPEPTREMPAGLKQWQSKHKDHSPSRGSGSRDNKGGAVITRYPPRPPQAGPVATYGPPPPQAPPPPPPYPHAGLPPTPPQPYPQAGLPPTPPQPYPQAGLPPIPPQPYPQPYPPPPPGYGNGYGSAPPPPYPQYPPGPPSHGPTPPGPTPSPYGQPQPAYSQPHYPPFPAPGYYQNGPPPPPPGSYPPGAYPPAQYPVPGPYPPPPDYHLPPAPPAQYNPPPPTIDTNAYPPANNWPPPPPGYVPPLYPTTLPPAAGTHSPRRRDNRNNRDHRDHRDHRDRRDRHNGERGRHREQDDTRRTPNGQKDRGRQNNRDSSKTPVQNRATQIKELKQDQSPARQGRLAKNSTPSISTPDGKKDETRKENPEVYDEISFSQKDLAIVFPEPGKTKEADPVGIPLPTEYNEDPTIPPAYNARVIKSTFFNEHDRKEFSASVRDSCDWNSFKDDPIFKFYDGMVSRNFSGSTHKYSTYDPSSPPPATAIIKPFPRFKIDREALKISRDKMADRLEESSPSPPRSEDPIASSESHKRHRDDHDQKDDRDVKRSKPSPPLQSLPDDQNKRRSPSRKPARSPRSGRGRDPWNPLDKADGDDNRRPTSCSGHTRPSSSSDDRPNHSNGRQDSGYYSGQSQDKVGSLREQGWDREQTRKQDRDRDYDRRFNSRDRDRRLSDESRGFHGERGRYQRRDSRSLSRSISPPRQRRRSSSWGSNNSYVSRRGGGDRSPQAQGLSLLDYELLGLAEPDEPEDPASSLGEKKKRKKSRRELEEDRKRDEEEKRRDEERERRDERKRFNPPPKKQKPAREVTAAFSRRW